MIRTSPFRILLLVAIVVLLANGCATHSAVTASDQPRTPLEKAKLAYAAASLDYETIMEVALSFDREGKLTPDLKRKVYAIQETVQQWAPRMRAVLHVWETSGEKPESYDQVKAIIDGAVAQLRALQSGKE